MQLALVAVGALRPAFREMCDEYLRRLGRYAEVAEHEVKEAGRVPEGPARRAEDAKRLAAHLPKGALVVACAREGDAWSSRELAARLERWQRAARPVAFLVGGSTGLDEALIARADHRWSLGPLTLPHELARVVITEQLYRACTILKGEPYHKGKEGKG
ncbi:MAG TPA: 23S rRNA (pseudouridine(1915)-N(3))-methyltransferase RlmH [Gemmatimonadales bacterium]|nr:23S rRNA (pseudouridine(1915)-N(3))-methyltransferase RlmH [Gemmatimonadales bacterium]